MKKIIITAIIVLVVLLAGLLLLNLPNENQGDESQDEKITSYEECVAAGYPILESFPQKCMTPDGETFTRTLSEEELRNMIVPVTVEGTFICLPLKNPEAAHNDICAFGLETEDGEYYGLREVEESESGILGAISIGTEIEVVGSLTPGISLLYKGVGTIMVEDVDILDSRSKLQELELE